MLEFLHYIDTQLFFFLNIGLANPVFDWIMPLVTYKYTWFPVWLVLIVGLLWKGGVKGRWVVVLALLVVALADQATSTFMKPFFERIRPCNVVEGVHLLVNKKSSFSMPSSHAANFFAVATVFARFYRKYRWLCWSLAGLVAYSRVAIGVHYPFDILVGGIVGVGISVLVILGFQTLYKARTGDVLK